MHSYRAGLSAVLNVLFCFVCREYHYSYNVHHGVADYGKYACGDYRDDSYVNTVYNTNGHHSQPGNNHISNSDYRYFYFRSRI